MLKENGLGNIVILNGPPRSGKSSIASEIQNTFDGVWMNLGVDQFMSMTPQRYQPGIGLRPGGERPDLESLINVMYQAMYESIAIYSRLGLNVVVDVGHHEGYSTRQGILPRCARILNGHSVLFVGVKCPIENIMERRLETWKVGSTEDGEIPIPVSLWQELVHIPGIYDMTVDTSVSSPKDCANLIRKRLENGPPPTAFQKVARLGL